MSPAALADLRLDVAMRRRALSVNSTIYGMRHGDRLRALAVMSLRPAERAAVADIVSRLAAGERWTDATPRRLGAALAPLRRRARSGAAGDPDDETGVAWHLARLDEIVAQYEMLRHRETLLVMAHTERPLLRPQRDRRPQRGATARAGRRRTSPVSAA
jgi:hypothetical protein